MFVYIYKYMLKVVIMISRKIIGVGLKREIN